MKRALFVTCISILLILIAGLNSSLTAQPQYYNYNTAGDGANSFPFNTATGKNVQLLYLAGDFNQPTPAPAGSITSVSFFIHPSYPLGPWTYTDFTIKMGQSSITSFTLGSFYAGPLTTVYSQGPVMLTGAAGQWMTITLDTPFPYDPTKSLIVDIGQCGVAGATGYSATFTSVTRNGRLYAAGGCPFVYGGANQYVYHMGITFGSSLIIGNTVSVAGNLTVPKVSYTSPREHVTSISSEGFFPTSNVDYQNGGGQGGAWMPAGSDGIMAASVQLPDGATVTKFRVYFYDNSAQDLVISLKSQGLMWGGYGTIAEVTTSGAADAYSFLETTSISSPVIDNINTGYLIWVYPHNTWDSFNLRVKGASIYYTLAEAP
jgi:hypothetical protein